MLPIHHKFILRSRCPKVGNRYVTALRAQKNRRRVSPPASFSIEHFADQTTFVIPGIGSLYSPSALGMEGGFASNASFSGM
jgi:hypothetical protein